MKQIFETYHICRSGQLNQYYTLYITTRTVTQRTDTEYTKFKQNLSHDKLESLDKVETMIKCRKISSKSNYISNIEFVESEKPAKEIKYKLTDFDNVWTKTQYKYYLKLTNLIKQDQRAIWNIWKSNKLLLKSAGFTIRKNIEHSWIMSFDICNNEELFRSSKNTNIKTKFYIIWNNI